MGRVRVWWEGYTQLLQSIFKVLFTLFFMDLSEKETREQYIDPVLKDEGWKEEYIRREVNSIKSKFKVKKY